MMPNSRAVTFLLTALAIAACSNPQIQDPPARSVDISGEWSLATETPVGSFQSKMIVVQAGSTITGRLESDRGITQYAGSVVGKEVKFAHAMESLGPNLRFEYIGQLEGNTIKGKASFGQFGDGTFEARRP